MDSYSFDIQDWCVISNEKVIKNGYTMVRRKDNDTPWLTQIYHAIGMQYPKFFKMDNLCKAGILSAEVLLDEDVEELTEVRANWAVALMNNASSLDDDKHYQETIQNEDDYYPSPAVFVYTLANIVTGEIAIRHKIGGESAFYVLPDFNREKWMELLEMTLRANPEIDHIVSGWVNYDDDDCNVLMFNIIRK